MLSGKGLRRRIQSQSFLSLQAKRICRPSIVTWLTGKGSTPRVSSAISFPKLWKSLKRQISEAVFEIRFERLNASLYVIS
jgi:hypothetical protein